MNTHYKQTDLEPIEVINKWELNFCLGNVIKYIGRAKHKGTELEDLEKAADYLRMEIERVKGLQKSDNVLDELLNQPQQTTKKVRIVKCGNNFLWYSHRIGAVFECEETDALWIVKSMPNGIWKSDCELLYTMQDLRDNKIAVKVHSAEEADRLGVDPHNVPTCRTFNGLQPRSADEIYWHHLDYLIINSNQVLTDN